MKNETNKLLSNKPQISPKDSAKKNKDLNFQLNQPNKDFPNTNINNIITNNIQKNPIINPLKNLNKGKRFDRNGNMIIHGGKQKVSFIDKILKTNFVEIINIENYKQYNKMEEPSHNKSTNCCLLL